MRCMSCEGHLEQSGQEVYRVICSKCGQNYFLQMALVPVPAFSRSIPALPGKLPLLTDVVGQDEAVSFLQRVVSGKVVSPLLLVGEDGVGRRFSVLETIREVIAQDRGGFKTSEVIQFERGVHPDFELITAPAEKEIGVEAIREVVEKAQTFPTAGPNRFFVVDGADRLSSAAANALLKTLEEPPARSRFFLLAESNDRVLPTIRSRCGRVAFRKLPESFILSKVSGLEKDPNKALVYTRMSQGSVGRAIRYWGANRLALRDLIHSTLVSSVDGDLSSALAMVDEIGTELPLALKLLRFLIHDILLLGVDTDRLVNVDLTDSLRTMAARVPFSQWQRLSVELGQVERRHESSYINLHFHVKTALVATFLGQ